MFCFVCVLTLILLYFINLRYTSLLSRVSEMAVALNRAGQSIKALRLTDCFPPIIEAQSS